MNLTVRLFGREVLAISTDAAAAAAGGQDATDYLTTPIAFGFNGEVRYDLVPGGET